MYLEKYGRGDEPSSWPGSSPSSAPSMNPLVGVARMDATTFTVANVVGGAVWTVGVTLAGFFLGKSVHNVDHYLLPIIALVIAVSLIPVGVEVRKSRREQRNKDRATAASVRALPRRDDARARTGSGSSAGPAGDP